MTPLSSSKKHFKKLKNIPNINSGGCLYAAYAIWLKLQQEKLLNSKVVIVMYYNNDYCKEVNMKFLKGKRKNAESSTHFGISFNGGKTVYDTKGLIREYKYCNTMIIDFHKTQEFCESALKHGNWNALFNRKQNVPMINKKLGLNLSMYY